MGKFMCKWCREIFESKFALWGHYSHCEKRPGKNKKLIKEEEARKEKVEEIKEEKKEIKYDEKFPIQQHLSEIYSALAEIRVLLRKIKEKVEFNEISKEEEKIN